MLDQVVLQYHRVQNEFLVKESDLLCLMRPMLGHSLSREVVSGRSYLHPVTSTICDRLRENPAYGSLRAIIIISIFSKSEKYSVEIRFMRDMCTSILVLRNITLLAAETALPEQKNQKRSTISNGSRSSTELVATGVN